jgi:hypothetical protein
VERLAIFQVTFLVESIEQRAALDGEVEMRQLRELGFYFKIALAAAITCTALSAPVGGADTATSSYALRKGMNEFGVWAGGSPSSNVAIGKTPDTSLALLGLRYGRVLGDWDWASLQYTVDIIPAAGVFASESVRRDNAIYGLGLSPIGLKFNFGQESWIKPFVGASVGFLYFTDDVPVPRSSRFNFTPELGLGVQFFVSPSNAVTVGSKYHHISNGYTHRRNPGLDSNVIYAGFSFFTN